MTFTLLPFLLEDNKEYIEHYRLAVQRQSLFIRRYGGRFTNGRNL